MDDKFVVRNMNPQMKLGALSLCLSNLKDDKAIDDLADMLRKNDFESYVYYDDKIDINFNGKYRTTNIKITSSRCRDFAYSRIDNYLDKTKDIVSKMEVILIAELKINKTFENLLHLVRFYEVKEIELVCPDEICRDFIWRDYFDKEELRYRESRELIRMYPCVFLGRYYEYNNLIQICPETIEDELESLYRRHNKFYEQYLEHILEKTIHHEYGHAVFLYKGAYKGIPVFRNSTSFRETQANYFNSFMTRGKNDSLIKNFSKDQPEPYHNPMLYSFYCITYNEFYKSEVRNLYIHWEFFEKSQYLINFSFNSHLNSNITYSQYAVKLIKDAIKNPEFGKSIFLSLLHIIVSSEFVFGERRIPIIINSNSEYNPKDYLNNVEITFGDSIYKIASKWDLSTVEKLIYLLYFICNKIRFKNAK